MIQVLSFKYQKIIGYLLLIIFYSSIVTPMYASHNDGRKKNHVNYFLYKNFFKNNEYDLENKASNLSEEKNSSNSNTKNSVVNKAESHQPLSVKKLNIGGPTQPEMSSFKPAGTGNMVNLFTGDFSYNIPLMDVGGYPINIFYDANISMEQEASWVGLGWNINPGAVNRNMRGVPDDFTGEEQLVQTQKMKPNVTWGVNLGADLELVGIKEFQNFTGSIGASLGVSVNNYLGPALDLGIKGTTALQVSNKTTAEKNASPQLGAGINVNLSSRNGLTLTPNVSLTANAFSNDTKSTFGIGANTSYNSRSGIKAIQIAEQMTFSMNNCKNNPMYEYNDKISGGMSTPITFAKPSYIPALRMPVTNSAYAGHFQLGGAIFGVYGSVEAEVYQQKSEIAPTDVTVRKPMIGYLHYQKAKNNANAIMDFTRFNDNEVTVNTPIISAPQYAYDVFSIQGEGTGGTIRAYRNDIGYVRDNLTQSQDKSLSIGADVSVVPPGHYGANVNVIKTPTTIGEWGDGNKLRNSLNFKEADSIYENVYFRNPGETSVLITDQYKKIGGTDLVRYKLGGTKMSPTVEPMLEQFSKGGKLMATTNMAAIADSKERTKRTQVINFLTAEETAKVGLDTTINNYDTKTILDASNNLLYVKTPRFDNTVRLKNHISQINVTEANGSRYVYGLPVYNLKQKDFTFSVSSAETVPDKVVFTTEQPTTASGLLNSGSNRDGYLQITETPAYAHSFLLTGLLGSDYVDISGNGITEDDLGNAVKFNYTKIPQKRQWRTPLTANYIANFNAGKKSDVKDDKGLVSYGERESWYVHSIESKTMIALFTLENREDGKGSTNELLGINNGDTSSKRLKKIDLYNKSDLKKNGLAKAKPIKTVNFEYSYNLCKATPDNTTGKGKLTLNGIYFTHNGQNKANKNKYAFSYQYNNAADVTVNADNPAYAFNASDKWNSYKPATLNPPGLKNSDYPYSIQDKTKKSTIDQNAGVWALKKILLPSGGQIEVQYESDDYAFVQNKRAANMTQVLGFGNVPTVISNRLYDINGTGIVENSYVFIKIPEACATVEEAFQKYLSGQTQLAVKLMVNMPSGLQEYLTSYATINSYGLYAADNTKTTIWVKLNEVDGVSPLSLTAMEFLRQQLPGQAFTGYEVSDDAGIKQAGEMLMGLLDGLKGAFKNPLEFLRSQGKAQTVDVAKSFVRLNDPDSYKYGGGSRVKNIKLKDNWNKMTGQYTSEYGQEYNYETTESFNGIQRIVSSGVASYEPSIGGEENPWHSIVQIENKLPLGPASYGAIEMPVLDAFFPAPMVGYSKVTVKSVRKGYIDPATQKTRSGVGKQVTEFYTAKDYPVYYTNTSFDDATDKQFHQNELNLFFYKYAMDSRALSQGFLIETNDMHGKLKSQSSYSENDDKTPISFTQNFYRNTGEKGMEDKFDFVNAAQGGTIAAGNMGIDIELMTDTREFAVNTKALEVQGQLDLFPILFPIWLPFIWPVSAKSDNIYKAVTTTKVINYHSIVDSVVVMDKGSIITTKNLVYDAETGNVIVSRTNNEFDQAVYNTSYPAYWAYSGMGLAYKNIDAVYKNVNFKDGKIISVNVPAKNIESGDELYLFDPNLSYTETCTNDPKTLASQLLWAFNKNKNTTSLTDLLPDYVFIDANGKLYTKNGVNFKIIRSGKRNMLSAEAETVTTMGSPIVTVNNVKKLLIDNNSKAVKATAVEYKEKWQVDNDVFKKYKIVYNPNTCTTSEVADCTADFEKSINPYRKGLIGNFKPNQSMLFYDSRVETNPLAATNLSKNGYLNNFKLYWNFNAFNNLVPDITNPQWIWQSQLIKTNAKGLELETKDALNIYTAAQYGFNKTLPVAIVNNARYSQMANESFEDSAYSESINGAVLNPCYKKHIDFSGLSNSNIINTDNANFNAHTGKYVLEVNANSITSKDIGITNFLESYPALDNFPLLFGSGVVGALNDPGGNFTPLYKAIDFTFPTQFQINGAFPQDELANINLNNTCIFNEENYIGDPPNPFFFFNLGASAFQSYEIPGNPPLATCFPAGSNSNPGITTQYINVTQNGTYTFNVGQEDGFLNDASTVSHQNYFYEKLTIYKADNNAKIAEITGPAMVNKAAPTITNAVNAAQVKLCPGTYKITFLVYQNKCFGDICLHSYRSYFTCNQNFTSYKSLSMQNDCNYTKPITISKDLFNPMANSMFNSTFTIQASKKMIFSTWVKENCNNENIACNNKIKFDFLDPNNAVLNFTTLSPSGPIIDGWQRYEDTLLAPIGSVNMKMSLINNSSSKIYFDDIRFHPFNANMKTYVYDPITLRLVAELDANNYATYYEYDEEGTLIRTKAETQEGIKTITETRSAQQKNITTVQ